MISIEPLKSGLLPPWAPIAMKLLVVLAIFAAGARVGATWVERGKEAEIAALRTRYAEAETAAALESRQRLEAAQERGDQLQARLIASEKANRSKLQENEREIKRLTTGRPCLGGDAVRLLNRAAEADGDAVQLPPSADRTPAAGTEAATDTDLGLWISTSIAQYNQCRDRVQALIDWHQQGDKKE